MKLWVGNRIGALDGFRVARNLHEAKQICCQLRRPDGILKITDIYLGSTLDDVGSWQDGQMSFLLWLELKVYYKEFDLSKTCFHILSTTEERKNRLREFLQKCGWLYE